MAKARNVQPQANRVKIVGSDTFYESMARHKGNVQVLQALRNFIDHKRQNPLAPFGGKDYPFIGGGPLRGYVHAGLSRDISIIYTISGRDPTTIKLFGLFTHNEIGTGTPNRPPVSRKMADIFSRQNSFHAVDPVDESTRPPNLPFLNELLELS